MLHKSASNVYGQKYNVHPVREKHLSSFYPARPAHLSNSSKNGFSKTPNNAIKTLTTPFVFCFNNIWIPVSHSVQPSVRPSVSHFFSKCQKRSQPPDTLTLSTKRGSLPDGRWTNWLQTDGQSTAIFEDWIFSLEL